MARTGKRAKQVTARQAKHGPEGSCVQRSSWINVDGWCCTHSTSTAVTIKAGAWTLSQSCLASTLGMKRVAQQTP
eukprot:1146580-Pelagomonas_calceolata.AAC.1